MNSDLFDVIAKVPDGTTLATANLMLQTLLADRFRLVIHQRHEPGSPLRAERGQGRIEIEARERIGRYPDVSRNSRRGGGGDPGDPASMPNIKVACHNLTAAAIAENLHQMAGGYLDHDVIDSTKLEGSWDFDLEWTGRGALAAKGADGISIFDAVDKQLGLKLELQNVPMPALVIESVNRKPTANPDGIEATLALAAARFEAATIKPADPNGRPFTGLLYTGGSQMKAGGTLRALIAHGAPDSAQYRRRYGGRASEVRGLPVMGHHGQSAEYRRGRSQRCRRTAAAAAAQRRFGDAARLVAGSSSS